MFLHGLSPSMQDHRKADFAAEILLPKLFEQLRGNLNQQVIHQFLVVPNQPIEDVVNRENDMVIMNGQKPDLLRFEPLCFFECSAFWAMTILAGFEVKLPAFAFCANLQNATQCWRAAIHNCTDCLALLIRKMMSTFVFAYVSSEDFSHIIFQSRAVVHG